MSYEFGRFRSITIDKRLPSKVQRECFYHELCHILRHAGRQIMMPKAFRELQEWDTRYFTRYAALPFHMITTFDFKQLGIIEVLSEQFRVTPELCSERLIRIREKIRDYSLFKKDVFSIHRHYSTDFALMQYYHLFGSSSSL